MTKHIRTERTLLLALGLGVLLFAFYKLGHYPIMTSLDEGYRLQLPKNLAQHGRWAAMLDGQFVPYWSDSTGPAVLLPITLAFKLLGVSLISARVVMSAYVVFTACSVYALTRFLYGRWAALLSVPLLLLAGPRGYSALALGREVFGEIPALGFFFLGVLCWCKFVSANAQQKRQPKILLVACACFGVMTLCKDLFAVFTCVTLIVVGLMLWRSPSKDQPRLYVQASLVPVVVMALTFVLWRVAQRILTQGQGFDATAQQMVDLTPGSYVLVLFNFRLWGEALRHLYEGGFLLLGIPALLFAVATALSHSNPQRLHYLFVPLFVSFWLMWFAFFSITWMRYAMPAWCASAILVSHFLVQGLWQKLTTAVADGNTRPVAWSQRFMRLSVMALIFFVTLWPAQNEFRRIRTANNGDTVAMAQFVQSQIPSTSHVLSTEWEVSVFTERPLLYPSFGSIDRLIRKEQLNGETISATGNNSAQGIFDVAALKPEYIVVGNYNRGTQIVPQAYLQTRCKQMVALEDYQAYQCQN